MDEATLLDHIEARSRALTLAHGELVVGPGDDCAVLRTRLGDTLLLTVDQLVEGRHFVPGTPIEQIAHKAVARSVSDIAAMGGQPAWALATGLLPKAYSHSDGLFDAMAHAANRLGCPLIGGDIATHASPDHPLTLTTTVAGTMPEGSRPVLRSGARAGDTIFVTGAIGGSFASGRHLRFEPRTEQGLLLARHGAHAMIDVSDGLGRDAGRIARASGVVIELDAERVPWHPDTDDWKRSAADGEDYELLATGPGSLIEQIPGLIAIGRVLEPGSADRPAAWFRSGGDRIEAGDLGWNHT